MSLRKKTDRHHWSLDRNSRKNRILNIIVQNPGLKLGTLLGLASKQTLLSHRSIRVYLNELEEENEIELIMFDGAERLYPRGYDPYHPTASKPGVTKEDIEAEADLILNRESN